MRKLIALGCALGSLGFAAAPAVAGGSQPGTPGTANCQGQTVAYLAQLGKNAGVQDARGLGQLSQYETANGNALTVQDIQAIAAQFCGQ
ncbi:MAG: hypothetical protein KGI93_01250 [Acidobacteriota bacterium]|nr:hypothetical protein [Acidobacteriota bacterium]MDE3190217.1 hypothetical protein [Acidobacteriota bacterium]